MPLCEISAQALYCTALHDAGWVGGFYQKRLLLPLCEASVMVRSLMRRNSQEWAFSLEEHMWCN